MHLLRARGVDAVITNPTPTPPRFDFLFDDLPGVDRTAEAVKELRRADLIVVLDICDLGRLGMLGETVRDRGVPVACIDHHVSTGVLPAGPALPRPRRRRRPASWSSRSPWRTAGRCRRPRPGGSTSPCSPTPAASASATPGRARCASPPSCWRPGVDPEEIYLEVYARAPEGRPRLFAEALQTLVVEPEHGLAWVTVPPGAIERLGVSSDDLEGVVEFPRSIEGVRMALLFREVEPGADQGVAPIGGQTWTWPPSPSASAAAGTPRPPVWHSRVARRGPGHRARGGPRLPGPNGAHPTAAVEPPIGAPYIPESLVGIPGR